MKNCIRTYSNKYIDLINPRVEDIDIESIAAALSKVCRYGGHCPKFYSVAEHCIHCVELAVKDGLKGDVLKCIFLHDASEAYLGDVVKPLKNNLPDYAVIEQWMEHIIDARFNLDSPRYKIIIKGYDIAMLTAEMAKLWDNKDIMDVKFGFWKHEASFDKFMKMAERLGIC